MKIYKRFCAHLERYSLNVHRSEKSLEQKSQGRMKHRLYAQSILSVSVTDIGKKKS
jgi:hypothetical protein